MVFDLFFQAGPFAAILMLTEPMGIARNFSWGGTLDKPTFKAEVRKWGRGSCGMGNEPPHHQLGDLGSGGSSFSGVWGRVPMTSAFWMH